MAVRFTKSKTTAPMTIERLANAIENDSKTINGKIATMRDEMATKASFGRGGMA